MLFWAVLGWVLVGSWLRSHIPNKFLTGQSLFTEGWKTAHWNHDSGANTETTQQKWLGVIPTTNLVSQVGWQTDHKLKFPFHLTFTCLHNILERATEQLVAPRPSPPPPPQLFPPAPAPPSPQRRTRRPPPLRPRPQPRWGDDEKGPRRGAGGKPGRVGGVIL